MSSGGEKYATYIANKLLPNSLNHDPSKTLKYVALFNGASDMHKDVTVLAAKYTKVSVLLSF